MGTYYVYILASKKHGTLYVGMTNDLYRRVYEHKVKLIDWFTKKYNISILVYFEQSTCVETAIMREKQLKKWNRSRKIRLIEKENPNWNDLYLEYMDPGSEAGMTQQ